MTAGMFRRFFSVVLTRSPCLGWTHASRDTGFVDDWWAETFGCARADLWQGVQVRPHARLGDYPGFWVAWRDTGVHVSMPSSVSVEEANSLATQGFECTDRPGLLVGVRRGARLGDGRAGRPLLPRRGPRGRRDGAADRPVAAHVPGGSDARGGVARVRARRRERRCARLFRRWTAGGRREPHRLRRRAPGHRRAGGTGAARSRARAPGRRRRGVVRDQPARLRGLARVRRERRVPGGQPRAGLRGPTRTSWRCARPGDPPDRTHLSVSGPGSRSARG